MIIECSNCKKKFDVNPSLIPDKGRNIKCGSCDHIWFYKKDKTYEEDILETNSESNNKEIISNLKNKKVELDKTVVKKITFSKILFNLLVLIFSFIALIVILDTFKSPLGKIFPNLELALFNLFETLKDIFLFFKNLLF
jgi:predicted Zn finger-like uncharacterized protein